MAGDRVSQLAWYRLDGKCSGNISGKWYRFGTKRLLNVSVNLGKSLHLSVP